MPSNHDDRWPVTGTQAPGDEPSRGADGAPPPEGERSQAGRTRTRTRRVSRTRQLFLSAINAQITGARVLALVALLVLIGSGVYVLIGTTGSPLLGLAFLALAAALGFTIYWFIQVMNMFTGKR